MSDLVSEKKGATDLVELSESQGTDSSISSEVPTSQSKEPRYMRVEGPFSDLSKILDAMNSLWFTRVTYLLALEEISNHGITRIIS